MFSSLTKNDLFLKRLGQENFPGQKSGIYYQTVENNRYIRH
ncbi:hypothetical protein CHCC20327_1659 [Bacillus licheniformis]|nr:hypothetical protein CHCC20327_1659 [Bacillus licheniformis]